jgi:two-component system OmpR family sensor kinase
MMRPSRLYWKLFLAFWLVTSLTFFVGLGILILENFRPGDPDLEVVLVSEEQLLRKFGLESGRQLLAVWQHLPGQAIGVYDVAGQLLAGSPVLQPTYERSFISKEGVTLSLRSSLSPGRDDNGRPGHLIPLIVGTVMSALFSGYLAYYLAWPLAYLRRAMSDVAQGHFDTRVKPMMGRRRDEIVDLAEDCDRMANQLKLLVEAQQHLLHDISHELRSPLTRMQAAIGLLHQVPTRLEMIERIERESVRMDTLIEALLTLARLQGRPESFECESMDVIELLAEIVEDAQFEAKIKNCRVSLQACPAFVSRVNGELLYRCFENVIRNAVRHTRSVSTVRVCAAVDLPTQSLTVQIIDQGPGVESSRLQSIFQPFERGIGEHSGGFGLGLAIASRAVEVHGGTIAAHNEPSGGLIMEIRLPHRA